METPWSSRPRHFVATLFNVAALAAAALTSSLDAAAEPDAKANSSAHALALVPLEREPPGGRDRPTADALAERARDVEAHPGDRAKRFALVRGLAAAGELPKALEAARAWRARDAYNLVVLRLLGDLYTEQGDRARARRAYSSVVELLPRDAEAQRALATVQKQAGDLEGAYARLVAATALRSDDVRMAFELADVAHRLGREDEAATRLEAIVAGEKTPEGMRYPAKQRLAQIYIAQRRAAAGRHDGATEARRAAAIDALALKGGSTNDIKVFLTWDTDKTDVDLWVTTPAGEKVFFSHREGRGGEALFDDVTNGYGPESFTAHDAQPGGYLVQVNYYGGRRGGFSEARGEVVVILGEGTAREARHVVPYRLFDVGQTVSVARVDVSDR